MCHFPALQHGRTAGHDPAGKDRDHHRTGIDIAGAAVKVRPDQAENEDLRREDDDISCRLTRPDSDDVWELDGFSYEESEERLYCMNCIHYREFIDWDTHTLVQEDWSLTGLVFASLTIQDDGDMLIACNIPYIDGSLELQKVSDEEYYGFDPS